MKNSKIKNGINNNQVHEKVNIQEICRIFFRK